MPSKLTYEQIIEARFLRRERGMSYDTLGARYRCAAETVQRALDPEFRIARAAGIREAKARRQVGLAGRGVVPRYRAPQPTPGAAAERDAAFSVTPTPNMIVLGDPLPGRSALDRRRAGCAPASRP
jgi:hypothetical protein